MVRAAATAPLPVTVIARSPWLTEAVVVAGGAAGV
jgi:hypothetical protein